MTELSNADLVDGVEDVLSSTLSLARTITEEQGRLPTDCPGWTVKDNLAHMVGLEQVLNGAPEPDVELPPLDHVKKDFDAYMERHIHIRRGLPVSAIADELAGLLPRRIEGLRAAVAGGDPMVRGPFGESPLSQALPIRVFDLWAHEQDIRRALGMAARVDCLAAEIALDRSMLGWSRAIPKLLEGVDGVVEVARTGSTESTQPIQIGSGGEVVARIEGDLDALTMAFCGRGQPRADLLTGDAAVVDRLSGSLGLTP